MSSNRKARHILNDLSAEEQKEFLNSFDIVLSDCDGVIWLLVGPIPDTGASINSLKARGKKYKFISNNSMRTNEEYIEKLKAIGVNDVEQNDIVHPAKTITKYLQKHRSGQPVFSISSQIFNTSLRKSGIEVMTMEPCIDWELSNLVNRIKPEIPVGAVILDLNYNLTFGELAKAQQHLLEDGCDFLVGASDAYVPVRKDLNTIGTAGFIRILKEASGKEPIILGKPGALLGKFLIEHYNITDPKRALFIGDALVQDIQFGISCGFQTLFVLTGAATKDQMLAQPEELKPDYYADGMADFLKIV